MSMLKYEFQDYFETWKKYIFWKNKSGWYPNELLVDSPDMGKQICDGITNRIEAHIEKIIPKPWFTGMFSDYLRYKKLGA